MKTIDSAKRSYPMRALEALGIPRPSIYEEMLFKTPENKGIESLYPWWFLPDPEHSQQYASSAAGKLVIPFAQAIGYDLVACFTSGSSEEPSVVVVNPWTERGAAQVRAVLTDFREWLAYAKETSERFIAREQEESED